MRIDKLVVFSQPYWLQREPVKMGPFSATIIQSHCHSSKICFLWEPVIPLSPFLLGRKKHNQRNSIFHVAFFKAILQAFIVILRCFYGYFCFLRYLNYIKNMRLLSKRPFCWPLRPYKHFFLNFLVSSIRDSERNLVYLMKSQKEIQLIVQARPLQLLQISFL